MANKMEHGKHVLDNEDDYVYGELRGAIAKVDVRNTVDKVGIADDVFYAGKPWTSTTEDVEEFRECAKLLSEGRVNSPKKAELLSTLILMGFDEENSVVAAYENETVLDCIDYLQRECPMCCQFYATNKMLIMVYCEHKLCRTCAYDHFRTVIMSSVVDLHKAVCPLCRTPAATTHLPTFLEYLNNLGLLLKKLLTRKEYDKFVSERKMLEGSQSKRPTSISLKSSTPAIPSAVQDTLVAKLLKLDFKTDEACLAVECCNTLEACLVFLRQECEICLETCNAHNMVSMLNCAHCCCRNCAKEYFTLKITERNITELVCIACNQPDILKEDRDVVFEYFSNMDIVLKGLVDEETHDLFQRKLRDWTLNKDLNFRWCGKCDFGFITEPHSVATCPKCNYATCADCRKPWEAQHTGMTCANFARWKSGAEQQEGVNSYLDKYGIECPLCHHKYVLVKGGCLHFTCSQCRHEFCYGCDKPFYHGANCKVSTRCKSMGIHAHHPRNCLFHLRDMPHTVLEQLLMAHGVGIGEFAIPARWNKCSVMVQKEGETKDHACGVITENGRLRCPVHYIEYLCGLIKRYKVDSVSILDEKGLTTLLQREGLTVPFRGAQEVEQMYRQRLVDYVKARIPL